MLVVTTRVALVPHVFVFAVVDGAVRGKIPADADERLRFIGHKMALAAKRGCPGPRADCRRERSAYGTNARCRRARPAKGPGSYGLRHASTLVPGLRPT